MTSKPKKPAPATPPKGRLLLIPNTLDFGCLAEGPDAVLPDLRDVLPMGALTAASRLQHWVCENAKTTRAFLKRVDAILPLAAPLQALDIQALPRPNKGGEKSAKKTHMKPSDKPAPNPDAEIDALLAPALAGHDIGLMSEAGLPGVADPGAALVLAAHRLGVTVVPIAGPSSLVLALAASGLNGQSFAFVGYLPVDAIQRGDRIRELDQLSRRARQTQLVIETPYRNTALWSALTTHLQPDTWLSVSCGLTLEKGWSRTQRVSHWQKHALTLPDDIPTVFAWLSA
ncbi:SAM-dependent methyltransferase [Aquabacterium sp.]|uniref:SAM-dependent methyltransferase n=1 Tax=Aquabacterium sp. TaxID=1872578 RepID=UPI0019A525A5|nr:SAM-dependent methyltransferase [Aquabacterium sp.]MBC7699645.1 SAM-dependent methyltransferase [Aquabacterium sp.]